MTNPQLAPFQVFSLKFKYNHAIDSGMPGYRYHRLAMQVLSSQDNNRAVAEVAGVVIGNRHRHRFLHARAIDCNTQLLYHNILLISLLVQYTKSTVCGSTLSQRQHNLIPPIEILAESRILCALRTSLEEFYVNLPSYDHFYYFCLAYHTVSRSKCD